MRGRAGCALLTLALAIAPGPVARAFDRVHASHSADAHVLDGLKAPLSVQARVFGPWQVQVSGSGQPAAQFDWQTGVPVPFSLVWDGDLAHLAFGDAISYEFGLPKNVDFDSILFHAQVEAPGYTIRARNLVLNVSGAGIGGPLPDSAFADGAHPDDVLMLRGVNLVQLSTDPPPPHPQLRMELLVGQLDADCPGDRDCDGVPDAQDNCPSVANADQADGDLDP